MAYAGARGCSGCLSTPLGQNCNRFIINDNVFSVCQRKASDLKRTAPPLFVSDLKWTAPPPHFYYNDYAMFCDFNIVKVAKLPQTPMGELTALPHTTGKAPPPLVSSTLIVSRTPPSPDQPTGLVWERSRVRHNGTKRGTTLSSGLNHLPLSQ